VDLILIRKSARLLSGGKVTPLLSWQPGLTRPLKNSHLVKHETGLDECTSTEKEVHKPGFISSTGYNDCCCTSERDINWEASNCMSSKFSVITAWLSFLALAIRQLEGTGS